MKVKLSGWQWKLALYKGIELSVKKYLDETIKNDGAVHLTLIDPDKQEPETAGEIAKIAAMAGTDGIMVGGSSRVKGKVLDETANHIKSNVEIPIILFPANELGISKYADAIFFMSLLNSTDPYYVTGAQRLGAPKVKKYGLEPIPMGYLIIEPGGAAGRVGKADPIPRKNIASAAHYALAAQYLGMDLVYLESGSGAEKPVPLPMVRKVRETIDATLVVGGGIKGPKTARNLTEAGADIVVTGTLIENSNNIAEKVGQIVRSIKRD